MAPFKMFINKFENSNCNHSIPTGRSDHNHTGIVLELSLGAPGFDLSQEVVLKSRMNWRAVRSDIAQMPWGVIVRSPVMVQFFLVWSLVGLSEVRFISIKVRSRSGDELCLGAFWRYQ